MKIYTLVFSLLALPAFAAEYVITGAELAGHAVVTDGGPKKLHVKATLQLFGKQKQALTYEGDGSARPGSGLAGFTYKKGRVVTLKPDGKGGYTTSIEGRALAFCLLPAPASSFAALAVPGLSTNLWNKVGVPYLDENVSALAAMGFAARRLAIKTEDSVDTNARFIAGEIRKEAQAGRRVILLAHSKGATDTMAALAQDPSLLASVAGVIAIQPVYGGSPVANVIAKHRLLEKAVQAVFEGVFHGQTAAVLNLAADQRQAFNAAHPYPAGKVPTVVVRSTFHRKLSKSVLWANEKIITLETKQPNDGMVLFKDEAVPGVRATIDLDDMDHFEPGLRNESKHTPVEVTSRGVLALLPAIQ